jgi:hypothetical protein
MPVGGNLSRYITTRERQILLRNRMGTHHFGVFRDIFCKCGDKSCDRMAKNVPV